MSTHLNIRRLATLALCAQLLAGPALAADAPGLAQLYQTALTQDPQYHAELARIEAVRSEHPIARAGLLPQLGLNASLARNDNTKIVGTFFNAEGVGSRRDEYASYETRRYSLELSQTVFDMRKFMELKRSERRVAQADIEALAARQALIIRLAEAYFDVLLKQVELEFIRAEKKSLAKQLEEARSRFSVGLAAQTIVQEAQADYDLVVADEIRGLSRLDNAKHALAAVVGHDIGELRPLSTNFPVTPPHPQDPDRWVESAREGNLALLSRRLDVVITQHEVKIEQAGHWPKFEFFASKSENDIDGGPAPNTSFSDVWGLRLNAPIYSGGAVRHRTQQALSRHRQSRQQLERQYRESGRATREAYMNLSSNIRRITALRQARLSAQALFAATEDGFRVGSNTSAELLEALEGVYKAERDLADARHSHVLNTLRLKLAVGDLSEKDVKDIEQWLK